MTTGTFRLTRQDHDWPPEADQLASPTQTPEGTIVVAVLDRERETLAGKLAGLTPALDPAAHD